MEEALEGEPSPFDCFGKCGRHWIYQVLFAKQDQSNITPTELKDLRKLAKVYAQLTEAQISDLLAMKEFVEICHE